MKKVIVTNTFIIDEEDETSKVFLEHLQHDVETGEAVKALSFPFMTDSKVELTIE